MDREAHEVYDRRYRSEPLYLRICSQCQSWEDEQIPLDSYEPSRMNRALKTTEALVEGNLEQLRDMEWKVKKLSQEIRDVSRRSADHGSHFDTVEEKLKDHDRRINEAFALHSYSNEVL